MLFPHWKLLFSKLHDIRGLPAWSSPAFARKLRFQILQPDPKFCISMEELYTWIVSANQELTRHIILIIYIYI